MTDVPFAGAPAAPVQGMAFLELGERLRQRGQFGAAATVALGGLSRFPALAAAHDLLGRIRADQGDDAAAIAAWHAALECDPSDVGARKGLAYVAFRARDFAVAERHLELASTVAPHDAALVAALDRVRAAQAAAVPGDAPPLGDPSSGVVLFDAQGLRLAGGSDDAADAAAAEGAGLWREATRAARLLALGDVQHLAIETATVRLVLVPVESEAALLLQRPAATPLGRVLAFANRARVSARDWLERMR